MPILLMLIRRATVAALTVMLLFNTSVLQAKNQAPLSLAKRIILPGEKQKFLFLVDRSFDAAFVNMPVYAAHGQQAGHKLCITAGIHGDEINGSEIARRTFREIDPLKLRGTVIMLPMINTAGIRNGERYMPDRRDLNRHFPGSYDGGITSIVARATFNLITTYCDSVIDLHTGSFERANLPQIRADLRNPDVVTLTLGFGSMVVLHSEPTVGTLRHAATQAGIPAVTVEAGGPSQLELTEVKHGVKGIETLLTTLGMVKKIRLWGDPEPVYYRSSWVRADNGGILLANVSLGTTVCKGDVLGTITDPMSNAQTEVVSPWSGRVIGMARNQVVMPGFAAFHVGIQTEDVVIDEEQPADVVHDAGHGGYVDGMSE